MDLLNKKLIKYWAERLVTESRINLSALLFPDWYEQSVHSAKAFYTL